MGPDDLEAGVLGVESTSYCKGDNGGVISGEEVLLPRCEGPVIDLMKFCEAFGGELVSAPVDCVVGRDGVVDKL